MTGHVTEHELPEEATQPPEEPPADCCNQGEVEVERQLSAEMRKLVQKFADFVEFLAFFNDFCAGGKVGKKKKSSTTQDNSRFYTTQFESKKNDMFSCGEELPPCSITQYIMNAYTLLELDDAAFVYAPLAYILKLHNHDQLRITRWNAHR